MAIATIVRRTERLALVLSTVAVGSVLALPAAARAADGPPSDVGALGPLIPFHKDAIHAGVVWTHQTTPKICFWMRPTEYRGTDSVDPAVVDPDDRATFVEALRETFEEIVFGGFRFGTGPHGLDESVASRIAADMPLDNGLCADLGHPDLFRDTGTYDVRDLTAEDFARNAAAFSNAGHSRGLNYNLFCGGHVALADGRWLFVGGHDKSGNNGIRKMNVFDPVSGWLPRPAPAVKTAYLADPSGEGVYPDANDEANTDPLLPSDMRYQRWYPSAIALPDGRALVISGTDQDSSDPATASATKVRQVTPEVYDPATDRVTALESARKMFNMYARSYVVQTGPGREDWKVAVIGEVDETKLPDESEIRGYDPWTYTGRTYLLDVLGALADPMRETAAENHWTHVATAEIAHDSGAGAALWELDSRGFPRRQTVALFGGDCGDQAESCDQSTVETIDFSAPAPAWQRQEDLLQPASQNNAVVLPTGDVVVIGGSRGRGPWQNSFRYQLFNPRSGKVRPLVETTIPRHDHSTVALLPDGSVIAMGGNRTDIANDVNELHRGVPVAQVYKPAYFFRGARPVIAQAPTEMRYGEPFAIRMAKGSAAIDSVVMVRHGPVTHNWDWSNRWVKLSFDRGAKDTLRVAAPSVPGAAVPGYYMVFAVDVRGVPSVAALTRLQ